MSVSVTGVSGSCPSGWLRAGDYCYWLSTHVVSFEDAQAVCAIEDASLVSLSTSLDLVSSSILARNTTLKLRRLVINPDNTMIDILALLPLTVSCCVISVLWDVNN